MKKGFTKKDVKKFEDYSKIDIFYQFAKEAGDIWEHCSSKTGDPCINCVKYIKRNCEIKTEYVPYIYKKEEFIKEYVGAKNETLDI